MERIRADKIFKSNINSYKRYLISKPQMHIDNYQDRRNTYNTIKIIIIELLSQLTSSYTIEVDYANYYN